MGKATDKAYRKAYRSYSRPDVGKLPELPDPTDGLNERFFWTHVRILRNAGKKLPLKPRSRLSPEEEAGLRRKLEIIAHQARYALAYLERME